MTDQTPVYLSRSDLARRIGVQVGTLGRYALPEPDVYIGLEGRRTMGWKAETIDEWNARRPGRGNWAKTTN